LPLIEHQFIVLRRRAQRYRSAAFGFGALQDWPLDVRRRAG
jgi:hypothetical protein